MTGRDPSFWWRGYALALALALALAPARAQPPLAPPASTAPRWGETTLASATTPYAGADTATIAADVAPAASPASVDRTQARQQTQARPWRPSKAPQRSKRFGRAIRFRSS